MQQPSQDNAPIQAHDLPEHESSQQAAVALEIPDMLCLAIKSDGWHSETEWVQQFSKKAREQADDLKLACDIRIHAKMSDCQIVNMILQSFGLQTSSRTIGQGRDRRCIYEVERKSLKLLKNILQQRAKIHVAQGFQPNTDPLSKLLLGSVGTAHEAS